MFEKIICHDENKRLIEKSIHGGNISHAYLFLGKKGIGKCTFAKEIAKQILNTNNLDTCPDYSYISKLEDKKEIVIEQVRKEIVEDVYEVPIAGKYKVYIIDEAESLNTAAQNAILKTLEEPPSYVVIILISSNISSFLPTIISRVNTLNFNKIEDEKVKEYILANYNVNLPENIIEYVDGSIGQACYLIGNEKLKKIEEIDYLYSLIVKKGPVDVLKYKENIEFNDDMLDYLEYLLYKNFKYSSCKFVQKAKIRLKYNGNYDIVIDSMLLKIIDNML